MTKRTHRRDFLKQTALTGLGFWAAGGLAFADREAKEKLNVACIGVGGRGAANLGAVSGENVVALCDVDAKILGKAAEKHEKAKTYADFRKMLEEQKDIDAVVVSTPDHTHAVAAMMALKLGKHVYCEKPLTHSIHEARALREVAAKSKLATSMGNQGTAEEGLRRAVEVVQGGVIGNVKEVHIWTNRPVWPQGIDRPKDSEKVPEHLSWDLWLGPAPERPFHHGDPKSKNGTYHQFNWRGWWDFGTGALGDMACHTANMPFMALKLGYPTSVAAESSEVNKETACKWTTITFQFPARGDMPAVKLVWYDGKKKDGPNVPPEKLAPGLRLTGSGSLLIGDKGMLFSPSDYADNYKLIFDRKLEKIEVPKPTLPRSAGHHKDWLQACKGKATKPPLASFDYAAMLTETILLGNVATRVGKKIEWDGPNMKATNCPEADQYIKPEYRKGWTL